MPIPHNPSMLNSLKRLQKRSLYTWFGTLACILAGIVTAEEGVVLCIVKGGHVAIEASQNGQCDAPSEHAGKSSHDAPCVDILVDINGSYNVTNNVKQVYQQVDMLKVATASQATYTLEKNGALWFFDHRQARNSTTLTLLRSTVLL